MNDMAVDDLRRLVSRNAVDNTIVVTFANVKALSFAVNWAAHLHRAGVRGLLVGLLQASPATQTFAGMNLALRPYGAIGFSAVSKEAGSNAQGGRWFHVLPLLRTGARVLLSDCDVVFLRDPRPYLLQLEAAHPLMDLAISSDAQGPTDAQRLSPSVGDAVESGDGGDLDLEHARACHESLNIGLMHFPPGARDGAIRAIREAMAHLLLPGNLRRVDQGPINYRWKKGADRWRWRRTLFAISDARGRRLCGLVNGTVVAGVLPIAQFGNLLTHGVLRLHAAAHVLPYAVHATFARVQQPAVKLARLREAGLWNDEAEVVHARGATPGRGATASRGATAGRHRHRAGEGGEGGSWAGYLSYTPQIPAPLLVAPSELPRRSDGGTTLPRTHLRLMRVQVSAADGGPLIASECI